MAAKTNLIPILIAVGGGAALLLFASKSKAGGMVTSKKRINVPPSTKVGKYFRLNEFLRSKTFPDLKDYKLTESEFFNVKNLVARVLDPLRTKFGTINVTGGGRPEDVAKAHGTTWFDTLKKRGLSPARNSDHNTFDAADLSLAKVTTIPKWRDVINFVSNNSNVRQAMLYFTKAKDGTVKVSHLHIAAVRKGKPQVAIDRRMLFVLDGKRVPMPTEFKKPVA